MIKRIFLAALLLPLLAFGQSYPSPTFNNLTVNGVFTATGKVGLASLAAQAANTVVGNATGSSASPTAITVTGCNGAAQALQWTNGSGFGCNSAIATSGANTNITSLNAPSLGAATATTAAATTNTTQVATTAMVNSAVTGGSLAGAFTTLSSTGNFTPSQTNGIVGTTTNNNANAGSVGEYVTATTLGTSITSGTPYNAASISLTAGDWDVSGTISFIGGAGAISSVMNASISTTSTTQNATIGNITSSPNTTAAATTTRLVTPLVRISISATTTVFLIGVDAFSGGTVTSDGMIRARRVR